MSFTPEIKVSLALQQLAAAINDHLQEVAGEPVAFVLVLQVGGTAQYVSNADRKDGAALITELLQRWEANRADIPAHYNPDLKP